MIFNFELTYERTKPLRQINTIVDLLFKLILKYFS
jgi:hypothetical protein